MTKKNLTLDETWRLCLSMWRWIARQVRDGNDSGVWSLKAEWMWKKDFGKDEISCDCFFCQYKNLKGCDTCAKCPGRKVDPNFDCYAHDYHFERQPIAFYNKLVSLNRKRKHKK